MASCESLVLRRFFWELASAMVDSRNVMQHVMKMSYASNVDPFRG
jgi:hypothetical protein